MMKKHLHELGATFYALWALLHVAAGLSLMASALTNVNVHLHEVGTAVTAAQVPALDEGTVVSAILAFHSFNMVWIGVLVGFVAIRLNWRNSRGGYWLNLALAGFLDIGLFAFLLVPGYMRWGDGWLGPLLFGGGVVFSTLGRLAQRAPAERPLDRAFASAR